MWLKLITSLNWLMLISLITFLLYILLNNTATTSDLAGKGMAQGYALVGLVFLGLLVLVNLLPFRLTRVGIFLLLGWATIVALVQLINTLMERLNKP